MIEAENLSKRFGAYAAIEDVSFRVERGEVLGFLGPNGAGKTTTMRILAGVFPPTSGVARVAGHDVARESMKARSAVGYFPERVALHSEMTVRGYLSYVGRMKGYASAPLRAAAAAAIEQCSLENVADREIGSLSKGFRQRVGIAQAVLGSPAVLILDEPTSGLDPEQVAEMRELIRGLGGERTVILSTHVLPEVEATCDRVLIIHHGKIVAEDTTARLSQRLNPTSQIHVEVAGPADAVSSALATLAGVTSVESRPSIRPDSVVFVVHSVKEEDLREKVAAAIVAGGWGLRELRTVALTLEQIFLSVVGAPAPRNETRSA